MSDPRLTNSRYSDPHLSDPVLRRNDRSGDAWGWIAGLAVLALIAFVMVTGWNGNRGDTASNSASPPAVTGMTGSPPAGNAPSTTGSGATAPQPATPPAGAR